MSEGEGRQKAKGKSEKAKEEPVFPFAFYLLPFAFQAPPRTVGLLPFVNGVLIYDDDGGEMVFAADFILGS